MGLCKAGDGRAGRRLTGSDARVGYRRSDFRPGLVPVLRRASARGWPPSAAREFPTVRPSPALHNILLGFPRGSLVFAAISPWSNGHPAALLSGVGSTWRAIAHRNAAISRAIAATTTALRLPFA